MALCEIGHSFVQSAHEEGRVKWLTLCGLDQFRVIQVNLDVCRKVIEFCPLRVLMFLRQDFVHNGGSFGILAFVVFFLGIPPFLRI